MKTAAALALTALLTATACTSWSKRDVALEGLAVASLVVDYSQTLNITADCREGNPVMGLCGQHVDPTAYFVTLTVLHVIVAELLPSDWRAGFAAITAGRQVLAIHRNYVGGYEVYGARR